MLLLLKLAWLFQAFCHQVQNDYGSIWDGNERNSRWRSLGMQSTSTEVEKCRTEDVLCAHITIRMPRIHFWISGTYRQVTIFLGGTSHDSPHSIDDDAYLSHPSKSENLGEIKLVIEKLSSCEKSSGPLPLFELTGTEKVHERSKKGLSHRIK